MNENKTITELIEDILHSMNTAGFAIGTIQIYKKVFARLQKLADSNTERYSKALSQKFILDSYYRGTEVYCHSRYCLHCRCIQFIESYIKDGEVDWSTNYTKTISALESEELHTEIENFDDLMKANGLKPNTKDGYHRLVSYFLEFLEDKGYTTLKQVKQGDVVAFIVLLCQQHYSASSLGAHLPGLRLFLRMNEFTREFEHELPEHLPKKESILKIYSDEEYERIRRFLEGSETSSRNKAITLLALETGLRAVDICNLKLICVDWLHNCICINQEKTGKNLIIPLQASFGNAIADYLLNERPASASDYLFLSGDAPFAPIKTHSACRAILFNTLSDSGIEAKGRIFGTRITRHSTASRLLRHGIPLSVISEFLGHGNSNSVMIYLTTEDAKLAECTLPLPKGDAIHES